MLSEIYRIWNVDYNPDENKELQDPHWGFEIIKGKFKGTVIEIENIDLQDENLNVEFHFLNTPDTMTVDELKTTEFDDLMQCVVSDFITEALKELDDKYRANDSNESNS